MFFISLVVSVIIVHDIYCLWHYVWVWKGQRMKLAVQFSYLNVPVRFHDPTHMNYRNYLCAPASRSYQFPRRVTFFNITRTSRDQWNIVLWNMDHLLSPYVDFVWQRLLRTLTSITNDTIDTKGGGQLEIRVNSPSIHWVRIPFNLFNPLESGCFHTSRRRLLSNSDLTLEVQSWDNHVITPKVPIMFRWWVTSWAHQFGILMARTIHRTPTYTRLQTRANFISHCLAP